MQLKDGPLEVLHSITALGERLGKRVAENAQATVLLPVKQEVATQVMPGLRKID